MIPADAAARAEALDIRKSFIVEAPAGSGKTALLIQRYLKLLLAPNVEDPGEVLAITFTVKATEEIRSRVTDALLRASSGVAGKNDFDTALLALACDVLKKDEERGWKLLDQPARFNIRTIDGLAASIAKSLPLLSGGLGVLEPAEDASTLYAMAARRVLFSLGGEDETLNQALRAVLLHRDVNIGSVEQALADMLSVREQWAPFLPGTDEGRAGEERIREQMDRVLAYEVCRRLSALNRAIPEEARYTLSRFVDELCALPGSKGRRNDLAVVCSGMRDLPGSTCADLDAWKQVVTLMLTNSDGWRKGFTTQHFPIEAGKELQVRLKEFFASIESPELTEAAIAVRQAPPYPYPDEQWRLVLPLFQLLRRSLAELQLVFAQTRRCDFTEISLAALAALQTPDGLNDLVASLGTGIRHLLMDEMQDTSQRQYDLLKLLTAGWDGSGQTVFLVGDPKQSIYIFREARVELFLRAIRTQRIGDVPLSKITLTDNFRSERKLVDRFNQLFSTVFHHGRGDRIEYTPAVAISTATEGDLYWRISRQSYLGKDASSAQKLAAAEERRVFEHEGLVQTLQAQLATAHPENGKWKIAILVRSRKHATPVIRLLHEHSIPVKSIDIDGLSARPEVLDLFALTRALMHPTDRTAWLAVMHAPWCGLNAAQLHTIAGGDQPSLRHRALMPIMQERVQLLAPDAEQRALRTLGVFTDALKQQGRMPFAQWVERTWRSLGGDSYLNEDQTSNALEYLNMLDKLTRDAHEPSIAELEQSMSRLHAANQSEAQVEVLTIHKSKGLEWDLVIVPSLEKRGAQDNPPLLDWAEVTGDDGESMGILLAPIQARGDDATDLHRTVRSIRRRRAEAELDRLLYVAATRARSSLHMFATLSEKAPAKIKQGEPEQNGSVCADANTLLRCAWDIVGPMFESDVAVRLGGDSVSQNSSYNLIEMPRSESIVVPAMAAVADRSQFNKYLSEAFDPRSRFITTTSLPTTTSVLSDEDGFHRPSGSLTARAIGDSAHVFLESLARKIQEGATAEELLDTLPEWSQRINNVVRSHGLGERQTSHVANQVADILRATLQSKIGVWTLSPHLEAETERAFLVQTPDGRPYFERVDRTFVAGETAGESGSSTRWIIDYKTGATSSSIDDYLAHEKQIYSPKMEAYASAAQAALLPERPIQLALYYPLLDRIISWKADEI